MGKRRPKPVEDPLGLLKPRLQELQGQPEEEKKETSPSDEGHEPFDRRPPLRTAEELEAECAGSVRLFGHADARLYPLLRRTVRVPSGVGCLVQVLPGVAIVRILGSIERVSPADVVYDPTADEESVPF